MEGSNTVEALWARALELSEDGSVHEAVLTFEQAAQLLEKQKDQAMRTKGAERVRLGGDGLREARHELHQLLPIHLRDRRASAGADAEGVLC